MEIETIGMSYLLGWLFIDDHCKPQKGKKQVKIETESQIDFVQEDQVLIYWCKDEVGYNLLELVAVYFPLTLKYQYRYCV